VENISANQLIAQGFKETMANSLTKSNYLELTEDLMEEHNVKMLNPLSTDLEVMRQSLLFSGLESVIYNINRKNSSLKLFEFGKTYHKYTEEYQEIKHLSLFVSGDRNKPHWNAPQKSSDFYYLKGVVATLLERLGISKTQIKPCKSDLFVEGISLYRGKVKLVDLGLVNTKIHKEFGIKQEVFYADILWDNVLEQVKNNKVKVKVLPKFPEVKRDLSLLLDEEVKFSEIYNIAFQAEKKFLKAVDLFDFYQGDKLESGKKSYAVSFVLQDESQTLNEKQITKIMNKLQASLEKQLGASLR
jgi:phenylalanyl-tRNA synthetase beta chain